MKLSDQLRKDAHEVVDGGRKAGLDWQVTEVNQWKAADLLDECENAFDFIAQGDCTCTECNLARAMYKKLRAAQPGTSD